ncbi:putative adenylyltransferase/sulfurtransferase MoeZ [archaeon HR01]|nr:putative adenylyltransferase/sulfurtransferase MoeZ [archaeon HR01]
MSARSIFSLLDRVGWTKLRHARFLVAGLGGLGSQAAYYLAAAGVGKIGLVDFDVVHPSNLQRQIYYRAGDVGRLKAEVLAGRLAELNPEVDVEPYNVKLSRDNGLEAVGRYDLVVDGTDNYPARYLLSDACVIMNRPYVFGSIYKFFGQVSVLSSQGGPCYRCLYPKPPPPGTVPSCADGGVLGPLPGVVGCIQAWEAVKVFLGFGRPLIGRLLVMDLAAMDFAEIPISRNPECPACGENPTIQELQDYDIFCGINPTPSEKEISPLEVKNMIAHGEDVLLVDVRDAVEREICRIEGSIHIPVDRIWEMLDALLEHEKVVLYCHRGVISRMVSEILREMGYGNIWSMKGGIEGWAETVDPSTPVY